jgi:hypothetical protein
MLEISLSKGVNKVAKSVFKYKKTVCRDASRLFLVRVPKGFLDEWRYEL